MVINHVVIEGNLATKPQMTDSETVEFMIIHYGTRGKVFGLFYVEASSGGIDPGFFRAKEGDPVVVSGVLLESYVLEGGESRRVVKIRALKLSRIQGERREPPEGFEDLLEDKEIPF